MPHNVIKYFAVFALSVPLPLAGQVATDPLAPIVAEALRNNLGIAQERLATERAAAGVHEARGRFFPSLSLDSRYSEQSGTLHLGVVDVVAAHFGRTLSRS